MNVNKAKYHRFTLRINKNLFATIQKSAEINKRAVGKEIEFVLENYYKIAQKD